jgi:hypothetical protein
LPLSTKPTSQQTWKHRHNKTDLTKQSYADSPAAVAQPSNISNSRMPNSPNNQAASANNTCAVPSTHVVQVAVWTVQIVVVRQLEKHQGSGVVQQMTVVWFITMIINRAPEAVVHDGVHQSCGQGVAGLACDDGLNQGTTAALAAHYCQLQCL